jgi:glucokinase
MRWVYAADLGGTNLRMAAVREDGKIGEPVRRETPRGVRLAELVEISIEMLAAIDERGEFGGDGYAIAYATPAPSGGGSSGVLSKLPNIPSLNGADLGAALQERTGLHVLIENDATAAAIGEHWLGAARGVANSLTITIGTGIGGGLIINGKPYRGADGTAGEVGHICIERDGLPCGCGARGCVEQYASVTAVERKAAAAGFGEITGNALYSAAVNGNEKAIQIFDEMGRSLGVMIASVLNLLDLDRIVIGGGGSAGWDAFMPSLKAEVKLRTFQEPFERVVFERAQLGDNSGMFGAALCAFDQL